MAFDQRLAERVATVLETVPDVREQQMFGGIAFMIGGHMACGIVGAELMLRLGEEGTDAALEQPHIRPMDFTGKPMSTMVFVEPAGIDTDEALAGWITRALAYVQTLPPKKTRPPGRRAFAGTAR
jgi:TfoX/Sxy family transcriptional regulator of competence genes